MTCDTKQVNKKSKPSCTLIRTRLSVTVWKTANRNGTRLFYANFYRFQNIIPGWLAGCCSSANPGPYLPVNIGSRVPGSK